MRADQTLERAEEKLRELTEEQEATAERLRKEFREATGLRFPRTQEVEEDGEEGEAGG